MLCFCLCFMLWVTVNNWPFKGLIKFSGPGILSAATKMEFFFWLRCKTCLKFVQSSFCYRKSLIYNDTFFPAGYHKAFPPHTNSVVFVLLVLKCDHSLLVIKTTLGFGQNLVRFILKSLWQMREFHHLASRRVIFLLFGRKLIPVQLNLLLWML